MVNDIDAAYREAQHRLLLLDYDGTLAPYAPTPEQAVPTAGVKKLLQQLASDKRTTVVIISGRDHRTLQEWLGHLPLDFAAEHGLFIKEQGEWQTVGDASESWKAAVLPLLLDAQALTPGSLIEETTGTLNWHYRKATNQMQALQAAKALEQQLLKRATQAGLTILSGNKVIVIKRADTDKGIVSSRWLGQKKWDFILAVGDDTTDEFMFKAMPHKSFVFTVKVGPGSSAAKWRLPDVASVHRLLKTFLESQPSTKQL